MRNFVGNPLRTRKIILERDTKLHKRMRDTRNGNYMGKYETCF